MRTPSRAILPWALAGAIVTGACDIQVGDQGVSLDIAEGKVSDEWARTYTLPASGRLEIVNTNGGIEVEPADGPEVEVRVERTVRAASDEEARALLDATRMTEDVSADRVRIEAVRPRDEQRRGFFRRGGVQVTYRVRVPRGLTMSFETGNGGIRLEDVSGTITASTTNGGITAERVSGGIKATAVNGGIRIEMAAVTADVELSLTNGGIRLELPPNAKVSLDATCINGGISLDDDLRLDPIENSREHERFGDERRRVAGTLNGGGPRVAISTVNGGIRIRGGARQAS
jgi:hypothetical protein